MEWIIENWIEILGYMGSALVVFSLMMPNILMLRGINLLGAAVFSSYGFLIGAIPVLFVNGIIIMINIYYIVGMYRSKELFSLMDMDSENPLLKKFMIFFKEDIEKYFPSFRLDALDTTKYVMVFRDITPVGVFAYHKTDTDKATVELDYISPNYRDYKNAEYLISTRRERFINEGIKTLETKSTGKFHQKYLGKIGFTAGPESPHLFTKSLS